MNAQIIKDLISSSRDVESQKWLESLNMIFFTMMIGGSITKENINDFLSLGVDLSDSFSWCCSLHDEKKIALMLPYVNFPTINDIVDGFDCEDSEQSIKSCLMVVIDFGFPLRIKKSIFESKIGSFQDPELIGILNSCKFMN